MILTFPSSVARSLVLSFAILTVLSACSTAQYAAHLVKQGTRNVGDWVAGDHDVPESRLAGTRYSSGTGDFKVGNPYQIGGVWYTPEESYDYDETGVASWYGPGFHGKKTANGEIYNMYEMTAAHPTLQMPSLVRVTNMENGRVIVVRINDRGPFKRGRIIDLSKAAAQAIGIKKNGTALVRVQVMESESRALAQAAKEGRRIELAHLNPKERVATNPRNNVMGDWEAAEPIENFPDGQAARSREWGEAGRPIALTRPDARAADNRPSLTIDGHETPPSQRPQAPAIAQNSTPSMQPVVDAVQSQDLAAIDAPSQTFVNQPVMSEPLPATTSTGVQGHMDQGRFLPDPIVTQTATQPTDIFVQVGSFSNPENARQLAKDLEAYTNSVGVYEAKIGGQGFNRVRVGPIPDVATADEVLNSLVDYGYTSSRIVVD